MFFDVFALHLRQAGEFKSVSSSDISHKILKSLVILSGFFASTMYCSVLISVLTSPGFMKQINSLDDLAATPDVSKS